jgi:hypothetical protein
LGPIKVGLGVAEATEPVAVFVAATGDVAGAVAGEATGALLFFPARIC